jgi:hypothetical protein
MATENTTSTTTDTTSTDIGDTANDELKSAQEKLEKLMQDTDAFKLYYNEYYKITIQDKEVLKKEMIEKLLKGFKGNDNS